MILLYLVYASLSMMLLVGLALWAAGVPGDIAVAAEPIPRLRAAFTVTFHYLFPRLTMGPALLIVVLKTLALKRAPGALAGGCNRFSRAQEFNFASLDNPRKVAENAIISAAKDWAMRLFYITSARLVQRI